MQNPKLGDASFAMTYTCCNDHDWGDSSYNLEIDKSTKEYMTTEFEHNKYFTEEFKEHSFVLDAITKQLDDISREVCNLQSKYAFAESLLGKISDAQVMMPQRKYYDVLWPCYFWRRCRGGECLKVYL